MCQNSKNSKLMLFRPNGKNNLEFHKLNNYFENKIKDNQNNDVIVVQIAGLIARRIVCETNKDQELNQNH